MIEPDDKVCPCCGGELHVIGEDSSEKLDKVPALVRVIVTRRPKYGCRTCEKTGADEVAGVIQAPAPARLIEGGLPTGALVSALRGLGPSGSGSMANLASIEPHRPHSSA